MKIKRADSCLDVLLYEAECDCIPNEFQCVKHGALDELTALRASRPAPVEGAAGEIAALRQRAEDAEGLILRGLAPLYNAFDSSGTIVGWEFWSHGVRVAVTPDERGLPKLTDAARLALRGTEKG